MNKIGLTDILVMIVVVSFLIGLISYVADKCEPTKYNPFYTLGCKIMK